MANNKTFTANNGLSNVDSISEIVGAFGPDGSDVLNLSAVQDIGLVLNESTGGNFYAGRILLNDDGTRLYINQGAFGDTIRRYDLSTAYDISTYSFVESFDHSSITTSNQGFTISRDGTKFYIIDTSTPKKIRQVTLNTPYTFSSVTNNGDYFDLSSYTQIGNVYDIRFDPDGDLLHLIDNNNSNMHQFSLGTSWDLTGTMTYDGSASLNSSSYYGFHLSTDGTKLYTINSSRNIEEYDVSPAYDLSSSSNVTYTGQSHNTINMGAISPRGISLNMDYTGGTGDTIYVGNFSSNAQIAAASIGEGTYKTFDLSSGSTFVVENSQNNTYKFSNPPTSGRGGLYTIIIKGSSYSTTLGDVQWPSGTAPTFSTAGAYDIVSVTTSDGGSTYQAVLAMEECK